MSDKELRLVPARFDDLPVGARWLLKSEFEFSLCTVKKQTDFCQQIVLQVLPAEPFDLAPSVGLLRCICITKCPVCHKFNRFVTDDWHDDNCELAAEIARLEGEIERRKGAG